MLRPIEGIPASITGIEALGKVTANDYQNYLRPLFENAYKSGTKMKLLYRFGPEFNEFTAGAAWEDFKVGTRYLRLFQRCAVVSDVEWLRKSMQFFSGLIPCPAKMFSNAEMAQALDWLGAGHTNANVNIDFRADIGVVVLEPHGSLNRDDFDELALLVDPYIEKHGKMNGVVLHASKFPGWQDFGSFLSHATFVKDHHRKVNRIAVATDNAMVELLPKIASHFVAAEIKEFRYGQKDAAIAWASGSS